MPTPRITVLLPVFNARAFIAEAVRSVLDQTFAEFELLVIDDGSTDGSAATLVEINDPRLRVLQQENRGLIATLNRGLEEAGGELIARMDADDISLPERFARQVAYLDSHPATAAVGGAAEFFSNEGSENTIVRHPTSPAAIREALTRDAAIVHPTAMIRRSVLLDLGGYRRAFLDAEDYDLWLRMSEKYDLANLDELVLRYRVHPGQVSVRKTCQQALSRLGCQVAAGIRREKGCDPADAVDRITPSVLRAWGVDAGTIERTLFASVQSVFQSLLRTGKIDQAEQISRELVKMAEEPSRWLRGQFARQAAAIAGARGDTRAHAAAFTRALLLDPPVIGRAFRFIGRRL
jgi:hypothetical protein